MTPPSVVGTSTLARRHVIAIGDIGIARRVLGQQSRRGARRGAGMVERVAAW
ncbi:hypothetical protein [Nocardia otitidiscaviarum]|uniref:hypothetical protein n=1 Tax=Nocardia otitidiscaviarum TaxID=1823 RepID=UPI00189605F7|nr:hypothetical protein [Nocardia otitidiscaviarum]MBF6182251.1 hypothetical protein [Nocardia otitidiscaviarum]